MFYAEWKWSQIKKIIEKILGKRYLEKDRTCNGYDVQCIGGIYLDKQQNKCICQTIVLVADDADLCWFIFINSKAISTYIILYDDV